MSKLPLIYFITMFVSHYRARKKGSTKIKSMFGFMQEHYNKVKDNLGLEEALAPSSEDEMDNYICKLRG